MSKINKFFNLSKLEYFNIGIVITLIFSRLIPHPPNFTPIISVAILSGFLFKNTLLSTIFYSYLTFFSVNFLKKKLNLQTS